MTGFVRIFLILLIGCAVAGSAAAQTLTLERGSDRPGADYHSFDRTVPRGQAEQALAQCRAACAGDRRCLAYTFTLRPPTPGRNWRFRTASCWLKNAIPEAQPLADHVSGVKIFPQQAAPSPPRAIDPPGGVQACRNFGFTCRQGLELLIENGVCQCAVPRFQTPEELAPQPG